MKRLKFHRTIVAIAIMLIGWLPSLAHDFEVDGILYDRLNSSEVAVTYESDTWNNYFNVYSGNIVIPSSVNYNGATYSVTSIGNYAFYECSSLTSIEIPNSVTSIGNSAFNECTSLTSIEIPNSVTSIGNSAFNECTSLTSIQIPNSVTSIGNSAFNECTSLTSIEIPNSVTRIGYDAFRYCSSLTSIQIPNSVTSIGNSAFAYCTSLTSIQIPNSVTSIGNSAFAYCTILTSIVVDAGNTKYDSRNDCNAIIETASNTLVAGCQNTIIPNSVTSIGGEAFYNCDSLTGIEIPNSVTSIGESAFYDCDSLTSVEIPNSVTSIGNSAFASCTSLTSIVVDAGNTKYDSRNECNAIIETASNTLIAGCQNTIIPNSVTSIGGKAFYNCDSLTGIEIPNSVTSIGESAFYDCDSLTSVEIPNSVTSIGGEAFYNCDSLTGIEIPNSVTSIGESAFYDCDSLTSVEIPNSVTSIGGFAFYVCSSLTSVVIGNSVTSIGNYAFYYCTSLTKITCLAMTPPTIRSSTFDSYSAELYVPAGCISAYQSANHWKKFYNIKEIPTLSTSIALNQTTATLKASETLTLVATVLPENATDKSVTWKSSNEAVATVDANGKVTAVAVGEATITATTTDGSNLSATCKVIVKPTLATSITLDKTEYEIVEKAEFQLVATVLPELTTNKDVVWSSSDMWVASVDENGLVRAYSVGEAVITATTVDGSNLSASCTVTVVSSLAQSITLDKTEVSLKATETATLVATVLPETTSNKGVEWISSNDAVATINNNGEVTAIAVGEAIITATTTDGSNLTASCKVTVIPTLAESITLDVAELTLEATGTATLVATVLPELATDKSVKWSSSDETVAIVDKNGVVTAISVGEATITATTADGSDFSASCKVTVVPTLAESITLDKTDYEIVEKSDFQLTATILPESTTNKGVVWSSSDMWIASVDENGLVRAYSVGEAVITATTIDGSNLSASCKVTVVSSLAQSITLDKTEVSLKATETATLVATVLPETTSNKGVEWTSSDESVAIVSKKGVVTAIAVGEAVITATTIDGTDLSASCKVIVLPTLAESITLDKTEISLEATETATLVATVLPNLTTDKSVEWSSSDESVAVVDENGVVTAVAVGEATITATTTDGSNLSASCKVTVVPTLAVSIELDQTEANVEEKSEFQLTATILPEHTTNKEVAWSSSKKVIATVDETGLVFVKSVGEVVITATTTDGSNLSATCRINVYSGIDGVNGDDVIVATVGDNIVVKNVKLGSIVNVYASNGALVASEVATDGSVVIEAPAKGIYVVKVGKQTVKVII